jgi:putative ABC transport system substrate-binding protein
MVACKLINLGATVCQARTGFAAQPGGGIIAPPSSLNNVHHRTIVKQTIQHLLPAVLHLREAVLEGGLMSYAPEQTDIFRRAAPYVDRILKGANP